MATTTKEDQQSLNETVFESTEATESKERQISFAATFVLSGLASVTAESFTYPLDVRY